MCTLLASLTRLQNKGNLEGGRNLRGRVWRRSSEGESAQAFLGSRLRAAEMKTGEGVAEMLGAGRRIAGQRAIESKH